MPLVMSTYNALVTFVGYTGPCEDPIEPNQCSPELFYPDYPDADLPWFLNNMRSYILCYQDVDETSTNCTLSYGLTVRRDASVLGEVTQDRRAMKRRRQTTRARTFIKTASAQETRQAGAVHGWRVISNHSVLR